MNFCDETTINLIAGSGGDGFVSFRREKFISKGGPDGGNGGEGGSIIFTTNQNLNTLIEFNTKKNFKAQNGENGAKANRYGASGKDLILEVPIGTIITDENGKKLADLKYLNQNFTILKGGRGGKGNAQFASSKRQVPSFAELGEPGAEITVHLELKLVADVGIIGLPSAGKSTLISHISASKPKIADYPFTTLIPNLGIVDMKQYTGEAKQSFSVVDIPGLIEGAAEGKGLGHEFLRHVGRAKFLIHLLDGSLKKLRHNFDTINQELTKYSDRLSKKEQIIVINKTDILIPEIYPEIENDFKEYKIFFISAITGDGLKELLYYIWGKIKEYKKNDKIIDINEAINNEEYKVFTPMMSNEKNFTIELIDTENVTSELSEKTRRLTHKERIKKKYLKEDYQYGELSEKEYDNKLFELKHGFKKEEQVTNFTRQIFKISGKRINQIVSMTNMQNDEAIDRVHDVIKKHDINKALIRKGCKIGDVFIINDKRFYFRG